MHLDEYRKEKRLTQSQFGELLEPPASQGLVSQWEGGTTRITLSYALEIQRKTEGKVATSDCAAMYIGPRQRQKAAA